MVIDFSNPWTFLVWYFITAGLLYISYKTKISKICLICVVAFLVTLALHVAHPEWIKDVTIHRAFNFLGLAVSISFYVVMDEVETRRKVISQVFKNRYKKAKLPSDMSEEELQEEEAEESEE